jgi:hypothetical protein
MREIALNHLFGGRFMRTTAYLSFAAALLMLAVAAPVVAQEPPREAPDLAAYRPIFDPATTTDRKIGR